MGQIDVSDGLAELVVFTLPGVQRYIGESRTTADLVSASSQVAVLAAVAADAFQRGGARVVIPGGAGEEASGQELLSVPNRIVALVPPDGSGPRGAALAGEVADAVRAKWQAWLLDQFKDPPQTLGFPDPQWVCVPGLPAGYAEQFRVAAQALAARRRVRSFPPLLKPGANLCSLSARWPAEVQSPLGARAHEKDERISAVNWVKRVAAHQNKRPDTASTYSIASAPFRLEVLNRRAEPAVASALMSLYSAAGGFGQRDRVPGLMPPDGAGGELGSALKWLVECAGPWVHPQRWQDSVVAQAQAELGGSPDVGAARRAATELTEAIGRLPGTYLALVAQDLDNMGKFLGGRVSSRSKQLGDPSDPGWHSRVSSQLGELAKSQKRIATAGGDDRLLGVPVYVGGDDLLMLAPAATAMRLARAVHDAVPDDLPTASTAVLYFSQSASLQSAVRRVRELLAAAKAVPGKHGLAVGFQRRSGVACYAVQPWGADGSAMATVFTAFSGSGGALGQLSPRLIQDLEREKSGLAELLAAEYLPQLRAELGRLVLRHTFGRPEGVTAERAAAAAREFANLLVEVGRHQASAVAGPGFDPLPAARVGVFLRQEAR